MRGRATAELERPKTGTMKMQVGGKKIKINELKTSPRHKVLSKISQEQVNSQGLRMKLQTMEMENGVARVVEAQAFASLEHNRGAVQSQQHSSSK